MIRLSFSLLALVAAPLLAAPRRQPVVVIAVTDQYRPLALDQQKMAGLFGERIRAAREGYLEHIAAKDLAAWLGSPGERPANLTAIGTYLQAAANAYDYSRDPNLRTAMDHAAQQLVSAQSGGHLNISFDNPASTSSTIWGYRQELLGLLAYSRITGDEASLAASRNAANSLIKTLGNPAGSHASGISILIEPLIDLYRYTADRQYLEFARRLATLLHAGDLPSAPLQDRLATLIGLLELHRTTGDNTYYTPVLSLWPTLRNEQFFVPASAAWPSRTHESPQIADPCSTGLWIQLTLDLFRLTGQPEYAAELEHVLYNQLFAAQDPKTGNVFTAVPLNGSKKPASSQEPCVASEALAISMIPSMVWGRYGNGLAVSLYTAGRATFRLRRRGTIQLYSETPYPATGEILLHVEPAHNIQFPLRLRVPEWTNRFVADVGDSHLIGKPGEFLTIVREWKRGDTVKIAMDMSVHVIERPGNTADEIALERGPQFLALATIWNPRIRDLSAARLTSATPTALKLNPVETRFPASWAGYQAYRVPGEYDGKSQPLILVPFADALDYRLFIKRSAALAAVTDQ